MWRCSPLPETETETETDTVTNGNGFKIHFIGLVTLSVSVADSVNTPLVWNG